MIVKRAKPEEIIAKPREAEVRLSQGESVGMAAKSIGVHKASFMVDLLASRVSPTAANLIDASAQAGLRDGRCRGERALGVVSNDRTPRQTRSTWP